MALALLLCTVWDALSGTCISPECIKSCPLLITTHLLPSGKSILSHCKIVSRNQSKRDPECHLFHKIVSLIKFEMLGKTEIISVPVSCRKNVELKIKKKSQPTPKSVL